MTLGYCAKQVQAYDNDRFLCALFAPQTVQDDLLALQPAIRSEGLYLALSHNSACNDPWLRGQLAKKMTELVAAGVPDALLQRNLQRWKEQQLQPASAPNP